MSSAIRVSLVIVQAVCNHLACTPPNPSPSRARYHTEELYILQIAPLIFKVHQATIWICSAFEILFYMATTFPLLSPLLPFLSINPQPHIQTTPLFIIGVLAVALGTYIRLDCFQALGPFFTFDLTVHPQHALITSRFYAFVRHPAYTGSIMLIAGLGLSHLTDGSWLTECGPLQSSVSAALVLALWWIWTLCVGVSRAGAEDKQMQKLFGVEWETYATHVPWWFFPGVI
ncbi:hypothetical protein BD779DRAFT_1436327 [Infundibulicybe gibba]|nr:hypothetical protein BD779DRAFT_1436327 [Infundibulicybe gibba]